MEYMTQLKEVQEFAMGIKDYPLVSLGKCYTKRFKTIFELNKGKTPEHIYHLLARSGSIANWLDAYALVAYIND